MRGKQQNACRKPPDLDRPGAKGRLHPQDAHGWECRLTPAPPWRAASVSQRPAACFLTGRYLVCSHLKGMGGRDRGRPVCPGQGSPGKRCSHHRRSANGRHEERGTDEAQHHPDRRRVLAGRRFLFVRAAPAGPDSRAGDNAEPDGAGQPGPAGDYPVPAGDPHATRTNTCSGHRAQPGREEPGRSGSATSHSQCSGPAAAAAQSEHAGNHAGDDPGDHSPRNHGPRNHDPRDNDSRHQPWEHYWHPAGCEPHRHPGDHGHAPAGPVTSTAPNCSCAGPEGRWRHRHPRPPGPFRFLTVSDYTRR